MFNKKKLLHLFLCLAFAFCSLITFAYAQLTGDVTIEGLLEARGGTVVGSSISIEADPSGQVVNKGWNPTIAVDSGTNYYIAITNLANVMDNQNTYEWIPFHGKFSAAPQLSDLLLTAEAYTNASNLTAIAISESGFLAQWTIGTATGISGARFNWSCIP